MSADYNELRRLAEAATKGEWFYNGYSAIFAADLVAADSDFVWPADHVDSPRGYRSPDESRYYNEAMSCVASTPAKLGDTATGRHAADAAYIAAASPVVMLSLLDALDRERKRITPPYFPESMFVRIPSPEGDAS